MIKPNLPKVGDTIDILGISARVLVVEPQSDWEWVIELSSTNALNNDEKWLVVVPTDYHTITNEPVQA